MNNELVSILGFLSVGFVEAVCKHIEQCDDAHSFEHVWDVVKEVNRLSGGDKEAVIAAFCHDIGCSVDRDRHHEIGRSMALGLITYYGIECQLAVVLDAILEHRSSWKGYYSTEVSEWVAAADRGVPDAGKHLERSYWYARSKLGKLHCEAVKHAYHHIREKFLEQDPQVPDWYLVLYREEWAEMRRVLEAEKVSDTARRMKKFINQEAVIKTA